ncbi:MAG: insulinase family protein [Myxococcales bacterium]|nr:insulinase family protein [Myxococcales bacterium]
MIRPILLAALLGYAACAAMQPLSDKTRTPLPDKGNVLSTILENGLRVVVVEDHSAPVVALNVWVRTGSADETDPESGMAHVFEHMLFKGTERRDVGEIAQTVEASGGNINAYTSFDMTVYHITMASRDAATGIDVLADAVQHSSFDPDELLKEQEVVVEEIRRGEDSPRRVLTQEVFDTAYRSHPYGRPVIGTEAHVRSFTREGLLDFYSRWYVPNNMTFVVVGDIDAEAAVAQIREAFKDARPRPELSHSRAAEASQTEARAEVVRRDFKQTLLGIAYPISDFLDPNTAYLDLLAHVLGAGETSRLYRNVKDRQQLVYGIGAGAYTPADPGLLMIDAVLEPDQVEASLAAIALEIERLRSSGPSEAELDRARVNFLADQIREKETMQGQARKVGYYETFAGGLEAEADYIESIRGATPKDLQRVAGAYLRPERANLAVLLPIEARPDLDGTALLAAYRSDPGDRRELSRVRLADDTWQYRLPNGLRLVVRTNHSIPLVALRLSFRGGLLAEEASNQGISSFVAEMLERGTRSRSAADLAEEVEQIAGALVGFSGRNSFGLSAEFLRDSLDQGLDLFADVLLHSDFPADEIEKLRVERIAAIERREDNLAGKAFELFAGAVYPEHPYRFRAIGTEESTAELDREALVSYYERLAVPSNGVLAVAGDVEPDEFARAVWQRLRLWTGPDSVDLPAHPAPQPPEDEIEVSLEKNKQQVHIVVGFTGLAIGDPEVPALEVLTQILSGQGGRLFLELRDRQSLAYSVSAFSIEGVDPGSFGVYMASAPDKLEASIDGIRSELRRVVEDPIDAREFERARSYLIGTQAVGLQMLGTQASLLSLNELYGLGPLHHEGYRERIEAVTPDDVRRVAERVIRLDSPIIVVIR